MLELEEKQELRQPQRKQKNTFETRDRQLLLTWL
jgi:hypothetical protein